MHATADRSTSHPNVLPRLPWWVQVADALAIALAAIFVYLLFWKIPRFSVGFTVVSLRSAWRVLLWAFAIVLVRHLMFRDAPLHRRIGRWVGSLLSYSDSLRAVLPAFALSRCAVLLAGFLAVVAIGYPTDRPRPRFSDNELLNLVLKWDGEWYLNIAVDGYKWDDALPHRMRFAFFPAFPLLTRGVGWILGDPIAGGLLVSLIAFAWALTYLFRLARDELGEPAARATVLLTAFYPFAVFYSAVYTESLFLLAAVGAFYHFRRGEWRKASAFGLLAGLTRPNGFLLAPVLAILAIESAVRARRGGLFDTPARRRLLTRLGVAATPIAGAAVFCAFTYSLTGDPLMWMKLHQYWGRGEHSIIDLVVNVYARFGDQGLVGYVREWPVDLLNTCATGFALAAVWPVTRKLGLAYGAFVALNVIAPLMSGTTLSVGRLTATLFPLFMWLATVIRADRRGSWVGAFATLQGFVAVMFFTWRRLF